MNAGGGFRVSKPPPGLPMADRRGTKEGELHRIFGPLFSVSPEEQRIARTTFDCPTDREINRADRYGPNIYISVVLLFLVLVAKRHQRCVFVVPQQWFRAYTSRVFVPSQSGVGLPVPSVPEVVLKVCIILAVFTQSLALCAVYCSVWHVP